MAKKQAQSTGSFPTVGTSVATSVQNLSGAPSKNTKPVKKTGNAKGGFLEAATAKHRPGILERNGASLHPTATLYQANAAAAHDVQRNVRIVPSRTGYGDFWAGRSYGSMG